MLQWLALGRNQRWCAGALVFLTANVAAAQSSPAPPQEKRAAAGARFRKGLALFEEKNYEASLIEFKQAYQLAPTYQVLFNIAQVHLLLQNYGEALRTYRQYLDEGGSRVPAAKRQEVETRIRELKKRVGLLVVHTHPEGAKVSIDDHVQPGQTPLQVVLPAGIFHVTIRKSGFLPRRQLVEVASEGTKVLRLELDAKPQGGKPPGPKTGPLLPPGGPNKRGAANGTDAGSQGTPPAGGMPAWPWWVATGVLAGTALTTGFVALNARNEREDLRSTLGASAAEISAANDRARNFAFATDVLAISSAVAGSFALYFTLSKPRTEVGARSQLRLGPGSIAWRKTF